ncbi:MAG TPA: hypothetical protein VEQ83_11880, partial [Lapillicoccus sp.]|nr:hypothetical protein [Lapillicoccus sp.]
MRRASAPPGTIVMDLPTDPDEATHPLAEARTGEPTAWFDDLYRAAADGEAVVPWDRAEPNVLLVEWVEREGPPTSARTIVVGAGHGRDAWGSPACAGVPLLARMPRDRVRHLTVRG